MSASSSTGASSSAPAIANARCARLAREQRARGEQHRHDGARLRQRAGEREERRHHRAAPSRRSVPHAGAQATPPRDPLACGGMRSRRSPLAALPLLLALLALAFGGCGSGGTDRRRRQRSRAGDVDAAPASRPPRSTRATRRSAACTARASSAEKDARQTDRLDIMPAASGAYVEFAATPAGGAGTPDPQRGARRRGDRPAPAHRRPTSTDDQLRAIETCLQAQGSRY